MSEDIHALSGAYAVDALDDVERARFERHLTGCSACRAEVESLVAAAVELSVLTEVAPPPSLRAKVLADIANVRPLPPLSVPEPATGDEADGTQVDRIPAGLPAGPKPEPQPEPSARIPGTRTPSPSEGAPQGPAGPATVAPLDDHRRARSASSARGFSRGWRVLVAAATVAVLAVSGFTIWRQVSTSPSKALADQVLAAPDATRTVQQLPGGGTATVVRSGSLNQAVLVTSGIANPPSDKVLQMWLQDPTGHMTSAGLMPGGGDQVVLLAGDASHAKGAGVTIEPGPSGSDQPTTSPIAFIPFA
ncbi:anti-sigma factor [Terrabacter sp. NPDC000476]|uniref:anti-sigma factor domain-containing protein n=1 Tax=Terrabacter sp. NPDC000476 TaxID=3154258 RepID=UPI0033248593